MGYEPLDTVQPKNEFIVKSFQFTLTNIESKWINKYLTHSLVQAAALLDRGLYYD